MNQPRRTKLKKIFWKLVDLQTEIRKIEEEEQDAFDNLPESLAASERGDQMQEFIELLDAAQGSIVATQEEIHEVMPTDTAIA